MRIKQTYISILLILSKNKTLKRCIRVFLLFVTVALLAPIIANDKPLVCKYKGDWLFPAFSWQHQATINQSIINYNMGKDWKLLKTDFCIFPPCAWSPNTIDAENAPRKSPFDAQVITHKYSQATPLPLKFRHWLGTTQNGNDVLSCLIHGTRISLSVGIFSMLIAALLGITFGAIAGYFGNGILKIGIIQMTLVLIGLFFIYFYAIVVGGESLTGSISDSGVWFFLRLLICLFIVLKLMQGLLWTGNWIEEKMGIHKKLSVPVDALISRIIEILNSIPGLLLIIAISAITKPSYNVLISVIGLLNWTIIARLTRAEYIKARQLDYVTACKAIGMSHSRIIIKHILPNVMPVLLVQVIFGLAGAVLIEASLSFIGVAVPLNVTTWGSLLNEARDHFSAWWLVVFPGLCIFTLIYIYNKIATEIAK